MRQRLVTVERLAEIARDALLGGYGRLIPDRWIDGEYRPRHVAMKMGMDCEAPYEFTLYARWSAQHGLNVKPLTVIGESQCRKCFACMRRRRMRWAARAIDEFSTAYRTWFATFTIAPEEHEYRDLLLRSRLRAQRVDFDKDLTGPEKFTARARMFGGYVGFRRHYGDIDTLQNYIKRLRKRSPLRYLVVAEAHSGVSNADMKWRPHFHMLIHEPKPCALVSCVEHEERWVKTRKGWKQHTFLSDWAFIRKNWQLGFTKVQLAHDANSAVYICKYLAKDLSSQVRIRASQGYGDEVAKNSSTEVEQSVDRINKRGI